MQSLFKLVSGLITGNSGLLRVAEPPLRRVFQSRIIRLEQLEARHLLSIIGPDSRLSCAAPFTFEQPWKATTDTQVSPPINPEYGQLAQADIFELDPSVLALALETVPMEFTSGGVESPVISLPRPGGDAAIFSVVESPIMAPELGAKFPEIKTYFGLGIDDPTATIRFDVTPAGFHGQVLSPLGNYYIDPYWQAEDSLYISYYQRDYIPDPSRVIAETPPATVDTGAELKKVPEKPLLSDASSDVPSEQTERDFSSRSGTQLRTYRTAVAATVEYTSFHGGTVAAGQAAIVTAINRVSGIYEDELSIRLELVANNDQLVYTSTDPYTNSSPSSLLTQNQSNIDNVIGDANYDVGHVFSTGGGGLAALGVVGLSNFKAQGETGSPSPTGDWFWVDYVAHELGHQFGANHTFNGVYGSAGGGNRNASTAYEPGSGSTIMAYAGICNSDDLQEHSDPYFHFISFDEIINYVDGVIPTVGTRTSTGNSVPTIEAGPSYVIPARTPFEMTASGSDGNNDTLTYCWEERDLGSAQSVSSSDNGLSPLFRSWTPTTNPTRTFPRLEDLLDDTLSVGEKLPTTNRELKFRATIRDNRAGGGGVNTDDTYLTVVDTGSPFQVTKPDTNEIWGSGTTQTVTWDVAGTTAAPISATTVDIMLSMDGGNTYPYVLAGNTPNDGSELVEVRNITTNSTTARIKVRGSNNVFFNISDIDFTVNGLADVWGPTVSGHTPSGIVTEEQSAIRFTFDEPMDTASFAVADDVVSFIGPGGDLLSEITGFQWINGQTLEVQFVEQDTPGTYTMVIGPNLTDVSPASNAMDQDGDEVLGEIPDDCYSGTIDIRTPLVETIYEANMDVDPGWTLDPGSGSYRWQWGTPLGYSGDPSSGYTGSKVIGYNLSGNYPSYLNPAQYATTPAIDCSDYIDVSMDFRRWLGIESASYDHARIQISNDNTSWTTLWNHSSGTLNETRWTLQTFDISSMADGQSTVYIRWGMGTTDSSTTYHGWNLDDVILTGSSLSSLPVVGSLADSPDPVLANSTLNLTASDVVSSEGQVLHVEFYLDTNSNGTFEPGTDTLVGSDSDGSDGWSVDVSTTGLFTGSYTYFAQATDDMDRVGNAASAISQVIPNGSSPTGGDGLVSMPQNSVFTFSETDFPFSDVDQDAFFGIRIASVESDGDLEHTGLDVSAGTDVPDVTQLTFTPNPDQFGSSYATFTFRVRDHGGGLSVNAYTMTVNVIETSGNYYVNDGSTTLDQWCTAVGDDANDGLTPATPKASVQAILDTYNLGPGNEVRIDTGAYNLTSEIMVLVQDSGNSTSPVTFTASPYGVTFDTGIENIYGWSIRGPHITLTTATSTKYAAPQRWMEVAGEYRGIYIYNHHVTVSRVDVSVDNYGIYVYGSLSDYVTIENCLVQGGHTGIYVYTSDYATVRNCTVSGNSLYGVRFYGSDSSTFSSSIVRESSTNSTAVSISQSQLLVSNNNNLYATDGANIGYWLGPQTTLADWQTASGQDANSFSMDPLFADLAAGDFHLQSRAGRYDPSTGNWVIDADGSPAIDMADPTDNYPNEPLPNGDRRNMGAYGNTEQASLSWVKYYVNDGSTVMDMWSTALGNDANDGLTPDTPKATVQAILDTYDLLPGAEVRIDTGTYHLTDAITVLDQDAGNSAVSVAFVASPYGVTIDRGDTTSGTYAWNISAPFITLTTATRTSTAPQRWMEVTGSDTGVFIEDHHVTVTRVDANANVSFGIRIAGSSANNATIENCLARGSSHGIHVSNTDATMVRNCTVYGNHVDGVSFDNSTGNTLSNSIVWADGANNIAVSSNSSLTSNYNNLYATNGAMVGNWSSSQQTTLANWQTASGQDANSISDDPLFADPAAGDLHLQSLVGRYDPSTGSWLFPDEIGSPSVDAGDPADNYSNEPAPNSGRINMGAYGNSEQASYGWEIYYVNDNSTVTDEWCTAIGSDANDGLTPATPKATVQAILSAYDLGPGHIVQIDTGTYNLTSTILVTGSDAGDSRAPVTFLASPYGVTISRGVTYYNVWNFSTSHYVTLTTASSTKHAAPQRWMEVTSGYRGIYIESAHHVTVNRVDASENAYGIRVWNNSDNATIENCMVRGNTSIGIYAFSSDDLTIRNCTVYGDSGIDLSSSTGTLRNNIIWADGASSIAIDAFYTTLVSDYNNLYVTNGASVGYWSGSRKTLADWQAISGQDANSMSVDPLFANPTADDFHLKSFIGRYDPNTGNWVSDTNHSPAIDAADPLDDFSIEPLPNGGQRNMGAYGNTEQASLGKVVYYVNDDSTVADRWCTAPGNDANDGLTPAMPKATVQAILDTYNLDPGNEVRIDTGTYHLTANITISDQDAGNSMAPVTFLASSYGVTIDRGDTSSGAYAWDISASYVTLTTAVNTPSIAPQRWMEVTGSGTGVFIDDYHVTISRVDANGNAFVGINVAGAFASSVTIENCIVRGNSHGIDVSGAGFVTVQNCTVFGNETSGVSFDSATGSTLSNSIVWADGANNIAVSSSNSSLSSNYNNLYATNGAMVGNWSSSQQTTLADWQTASGRDVNSISVDPLFADPTTGDFHLKSPGGRYDPSTGSWFSDDELGSPSIDAADPADNYDTEPMPNGSQLNMGAYGNTEQASRSWVVYYVNDDSTVMDLWCTAIGSDANDGLTPATPKATVQAILSTYDLGPGHIVRIDTGTYNLTSDIIVGDQDAGDLTTPVTFIASPYGVTIDRGNTSSYPWYIQAPYITLTTASSTKYAAPQRWMEVTGGSRGVYISDHHVTVNRVDVNKNRYGIYVSGSSSDHITIENCLVRDSDQGIYISYADNVTIRNCTIYSNESFSDGVYLYGANVTLTNNIIWVSSSYATAVYFSSGTLVSDYNNLYATSGARVGYSSGSQTTLAAWQAATGQDANSIHLNPFFVNVSNGDFHLQSTSGRYEPSTGYWVTDTLHSPSIDTGVPSDDFDNEPIPNGDQINMGAYGNTQQASLSIIIGPATYYVNDDSTSTDQWCTAIGADTNNGLSPATPKASVQAILDTYDLKPGDTVRIDTGTYNLANTISISDQDAGDNTDPVMFVASPYGVTIDRGDTSSNAWEIDAPYISLTTATSTQHTAPKRWMEITGGDRGISVLKHHVTLSRVDTNANASYGIFVSDSSASDVTIENSLVRGNNTGVFVSTNTSMAIRNCTIYGNETYGVIFINSSGSTLNNNLIWANSANANAVYLLSSTLVSDYNNLYATNGANIGFTNAPQTTLADWQTATGQDANSISVDPRFVDPAAGDFHLKSLAGRYDPSTGNWVADTIHSPAIDMADPNDDYDNEPVPHGDRLNMGAYGNTEQASLTIVPGPTYYVNDDSISTDLWCTAIGDDTNNGLTPATPKASVQAILDAYDLEPGDIVRIDTGTYNLNNTITVLDQDAGDSTDPVTFEASPYGVTIDRGNTGSSVWQIDAPYITLTTATSTQYAAPQRWMEVTGGYRGVYIPDSSHVTVNCLDVNANNYYGIGIVNGTDNVIENCVVRGNGSYGIYISSADDMTVRNGTLYGNGKNGIYLYNSTGITLENSIIWADGTSNDAIYFSNSTLVSNYNNLYATNGANIGFTNAPQTTLADWQTATGQDANSISVDPRFVDPAAGDLHLKSTIGRYDPSTGNWVADTIHSPAIDAADPNDDYANEPVPNGDRLNMGAFGNTEQASLSDDAVQGIVEARHVFYNNSSFDGNTPGADAADDNAIDPTKQVLLPGETATFDNYTAYARGINGLMIDITGLGATPTTADFAFKVGNDSNPAGWVAAANPQSISVRTGAGVNGSDRLTLIWADNDWQTSTPDTGAIAKQWLEVTMLANSTTGLEQNDVFYIGNAVGETGNSAGDSIVNASDELGARNNPHIFLDPALVDDLYDFDRDSRVNATDQIIARSNQTFFLSDLNLITPPAIVAKAVGESLDDPLMEFSTSQPTFESPIPIPSGESGRTKPRKPGTATSTTRVAPTNPSSHRSDALRHAAAQWYAQSQSHRSKRPFDTSTAKKASDEVFKMLISEVATTDPTHD